MTYPLFGSCKKSLNIPVYINSFCSQNKYYVKQLQNQPKIHSLIQDIKQ